MILIKSAFWMVIAIILCCFACACTSSIPPTVNQTSATGPSIIDKTPRDGPQRDLFETAYEDLVAGPPEEINLTGLTIRQVHGSGVDINGTASSWILGVQNPENRSYLLVYEDGLWRAIAWGEAFNTSPIVVDSILLPTEIYETHKTTIENALQDNSVNATDLDLSDGIYAISVRSADGIGLIRIDAVTGKEVSP